MDVTAAVNQKESGVKTSKSSINEIPHFQSRITMNGIDDPSIWWLLNMTYPTESQSG